MIINVLKTQTKRTPQKKPIFKKKKRKQLRQRIKTDESDDETVEQVSSILTEMKEIQKLRGRPNGISIAGLALGSKADPEDSIPTKDVYNVNVGGMINMQALKSGQLQQVDDAYDTGIGTQFSVETNKRDEDEDMMRFIEEELSKRKGKEKLNKNGEVVDKEPKYITPEESALQSVPTHLRESSAKTSEEMLSNQMLSGIPEVDLGIEAKIKNIEATEDAKLRLLWEKQNKKDGPSQFVPTNMAVNFVHHNRFNIDQSEIPKKKIKAEPELEKPKKKSEKATDDYHYEKFKKQFRR
ncbi:splicing factor C9orf78 [Leptinotarsa decemlineata]|uniref:splicing factor C9orf78 n=1 Tax=Leptinotarsa decemlineata TaxID=7539 RepID=UPI003D3077B7